MGTKILTSTRIISSVVDITAARLLIFLSSERGLHASYLDLDRAFTNGMFQRSVYVELLYHTYDKMARKALYSNRKGHLTGSKKTQEPGIKCGLKNFERCV